MAPSTTNQTIQQHGYQLVLILGTSLFLFYQICIMFKPVLPSLLAACLWFAALTPLKFKLEKYIVVFQRQISHPSSPVILSAALIVVTASLIAAKHTSYWYVVSVSLTGMVYLLLAFASPEITSTIVLWLFGIFMSAIPIYFTSLALFTEMNQASSLLAETIGKLVNDEGAKQQFSAIWGSEGTMSTLKMLEKYEHLPLAMLMRIEDELASIVDLLDASGTAGSIFRDTIRPRLQDLKYGLTASQIVDYGKPILSRQETTAMVKQATSLLSTFVGFMLILFYMLQNSGRILHFLERISPYSHGDTMRFAKSIQRSASSILFCDFGIFIVHFMVTVVTFRWFGLFPVYSIALLSGILAVLPLASNNVFWILGSVYLFWQGQLWQSVALAAIHFGTWFLVDPALYALVPLGHYYVSASGVALGLATYGVEGAYIGPIILCVFFSIIEVMTKEHSE